MVWRTVEVGVKRNEKQPENKYQILWEFHDFKKYIEQDIYQQNDNTDITKDKEKKKNHCF